jgi:hypothetical protein
VLRRLTAQTARENGTGALRNIRTFGKSPCRGFSKNIMHAPTCCIRPCSEDQVISHQTPFCALYVSGIVMTRMYDFTCQTAQRHDSTIRCPSMHADCAEDSASIQRHTLTGSCFIRRLHARTCEHRQSRIKWVLRKKMCIVAFIRRRK